MFLISCSVDQENKNEYEKYLYWKMQSSLTPENDREDTKYIVDETKNYSAEEIEVLKKILVRFGNTYVITKDNEIFVSKLFVPDHYTMAYINEEVQNSLRVIK